MKSFTVRHDTGWYLRSKHTRPACLSPNVMWQVRDGWGRALTCCWVAPASLPRHREGKLTVTTVMKSHHPSRSTPPSSPTPPQLPSAILITHPVFLETTFNAPWSGGGESSSHRHCVCTSDGQDATSWPPFALTDTLLMSRDGCQCSEGVSKWTDSGGVNTLPNPWTTLLD